MWLRGGWVLLGQGEWVCLGCGCLGGVSVRAMVSSLAAQEGIQSYHLKIPSPTSSPRAFEALPRKDTDLPEADCASASPSKSSILPYATHLREWEGRLCGGNAKPPHAASPIGARFSNFPNFWNINVVSAELFTVFRPFVLKFAAALTRGIFYSAHK